MTSRFDSALNEAAAARPSIGMFIACDLDLVSQHIRAHDGIGTISFGGNDYKGVGIMGGVELAEESVDVVGRPLKLTLSGVESDNLLDDVLVENNQGRPATLYLGLFSNDTQQLVDTPEILWRGVIDRISIRKAKGVGEITVHCESRLRREPRIARYTDQDQQLAHPGDRFFDLVPKIQGYPGKWGSQSVCSGGSGVKGIGRTRVKNDWET